MPDALLIVAGYAFCSLAIVLSGRACLERLHLQTLAAEQWALSWMLGSAVFSLLLLGLCALHHIGRWELGGLLFCAIAAGWRTQWSSPPFQPRFPWWIAAIFLGVYFVAAMAPSADSDGFRYHLGFPRLYLSRGGLFPVREDFYSAFPQGMEMQFLLALQFGGFSVANLLHWNALAALAAGMCATGQRLGAQWAGAAAAAVTVCSSVVGTTVASASVDVALAAAIWISFHCWTRWRETDSTGWLTAAASGTGFACAIKYTGISAVAVAAMFLWSRPARVRNTATATATAAIYIAPWLFRNWIYFRNPVYPFLNSIFPNPYLLPSSEAAWREVVQNFGGAAFNSSYPWEAAIRGVMPMGFAGPFFLLAPLALWTLRHPRGVWILAAGAITALPWIFGNPILRFAIPAMPFLALALSISIGSIPRLGRSLLMAAVALQAVMCFPPFIERWNKQWIVALKEIPWRAALRLQSPEEYWRKAIPSYGLLERLESNTPPGARILAFDGQDQFFTTRLLANPYASEESASAAALLERAADTTAWPSVRCAAELAGVQASHLRIQQEQAEAAPWTVFELNVEGSAGASLTANPNPWEADLTLDGNAVTAWSSKEGKRQDMWLAVHWDRPRNLHGVSLITTLAYGGLRVAVSNGGTSWEKTARMECLPIPVEDFPRRSVQELRRRGWPYVIAGRNYPWLEQALAQPDAWGLRVILQSGPMKLLRAD
ncbi:MAG: hypothetical protein SFV51_17975 [Bryobacteraceae bacterium]|nr:hypothetical protein [Bryobacteraceae bacterium]